MKATCVALLFLVVAGCGCKDCGKKDEGGPDAVARLDARHTLTAPVTVGNLTVWPVVTDKPLDLGEFLTLDEALAKGKAEVREVGAPAAAAQTAQVHVGGAQVEEPATEPAERAADAQQEVTRLVHREGVPIDGQEVQTLTQVLQSLDGAAVNTLVIENKGDVPILVCAGTVVKGGNQDRQIGQDFVLKANTTTPVDAFCVEQGRWQSGRMGVDTDGKFEVLEGMATAKVRAKGQYEKDQGGVWQEVAAVKSTVTMSEPITFANPSSPEATFALALAREARESTSLAVAIDANAAASAEDLKRFEEAVKKHFAAHPDAVGFAYAVNGETVAVRTFAHPRLLGKQLDDFVRAMATEALLAKPDATAKQASAADVVNLVAAISAAAEQVTGTAGLNRNGVRVSETGYNANCYVEDREGRQAILTQDWTKK